MSVVDVWTQVTTERMEAQAWLSSLNRWTGRDARAHSVAELCQSMDQAGVDQALVSAWYGPMGPLISNEEVAGQIEAGDGRLFGLASVDIRRPSSAVAELRRWLELETFVGVRIVPWLWDLPPNHRLYYPIYAACVELGVPLCTQIGHTGPMMRSETGRMIPYLEDVMLDFPELVVVGGHVGFPWLDELTTMTVKFKDFYVDCSAYTLARLPAPFVSFMQNLGKSRIMFGTNWPMVEPKKSLDGLHGLGLSPDTKELFLHENATRVFKLPPLGIA